MTNNPFLSHLKKKDGKVIDKKYLEEHVKGVFTKAKKSLKTTNFQLNTEGVLEVITKLHDLGKYTSYFQTYLETGKKHRENLHHHAFIGALTAFNYLKEKDIEKALLTYFVIKYHHGNLIDIKECFETQDRPLLHQTINQSKDLLPKLELVNREIDFDLNKKHLPITLVDLWEVIENLIDLNSPKSYFLLNYLFSLLIEADKLDASRTELYPNRILVADKVEIHLSKMDFETRKKGKADIHYELVSEMRTDVRKQVLKRLEDPEILEQKLFTLTAPTGVGKTLTSLDFALKLKEKVPSLEKSQIIYALPFINIIEQGFDEYRKVFGKNAKVLAHYQYADVFSEDPSVSNDDSEDDYHKKLMELDTWQADIVITSFVQFFHTLIGYRNKILKKFNHFANSIIILDEVQTIRLDQLPLIGTMLYYLSEYLNARIIMMTATQPQLMQLAETVILCKEKDKPKPHTKELLLGYENIYEGYKRTCIVSKLSIELDKTNVVNDFIEQLFLPNWSKEESCIIVVNKVNRCIEMFEAINSHLEKNKLAETNPIYCLSTNLMPIHRAYVIHRIKKELKLGKKPILIATQVVEAGVNLDFDMGFRDLGPIDSIVQVAGRINRNAFPKKPEKEHLPLYIMNLYDCQDIYGQDTTQNAQKALQSNDIILEANYLKLVEKYFEDFKPQKGYALDLFDAVKNCRYDSKCKKKELKYISDFEMIEERKNIVSVFINVGRKAKMCEKAYLDLKKDGLSKDQRLQLKEIFDTKFKKDFHQRIITVPKYYTENLKPLHESNPSLLVATKEEYDWKTGFDRKSKKVETEKIYHLSL